MLIALDYDNTYTVDPTLWQRFISDATARGHDVKIVTMRYPSEIITAPPAEVVYTSRKAKRKFFAADIWIDDSPQWVYSDAIT
jgi:hypothetical protein